MRHRLKRTPNWELREPHAWVTLEGRLSLMAQGKHMLAADTFTASEEKLHEIARTITGLEDFGSAAYRAGLKVLLQSMDRDLKLTPMGREFAAGTVVGTLASRLHVHEGWKRHPQCLQ